MNNTDKHRQLVRRLVKPSEEIFLSIGPQEVDAIHFALGIAGESGEIVDMIKKNVINGHAGSTEKLLAEIGDLMFYIQGLLALIGYNLDDALMCNITKLECRYPDGYSDQASIDRRDVG
jgi:NTP pyrophosphatase (non-canonical NTP hydrolase)